MKKSQELERKLISSRSITDLNLEVETSVKNLAKIYSEKKEFDHSNTDLSDIHTSVKNLSRVYSNDQLSPEKPPRAPTKPPRRIFITQETCSICNKVAYPLDSIRTDKLYHKQCFRCATCQCCLKLGNFASLNGQTFCKPHFKQNLLTVWIS